jgi:ATP-binding cassette subfamily B multidrug efflux pump
VKHLKSLNKYFLKYFRHFILGILFVTISNLFGIFPAQITRNALDVVAANLDTIHLFNGFGLKGNVEKILSYSILLFGIILISMAILKGVFMFFMRQMIIVMSRHVEYDQKNEIYRHYQKLGMSFYSQNNTGDLMNRISEDVGRVRMYVGPAIMYTINLIVMFILVIWAMVSVNPRLAFYVLLPLPLMSFLVYKVQDLINVKSEGVQSKLSDLSTFVQETFSGIRVLKAYAREESFNKAYTKQAQDYRNRSMDLVQVNALFMPSMMLLVGLSTIITVYVGSLEVMSGRLSVGNIAEFVIYVNMLTWPVASLGWVVTLVQRAAASQERINEFLDIKPDIVSGTYIPESFKGAVEFRNVSVRYAQSGVKAIDNISFSLKEGESLGIIGRTGSGKTTLVNTLLRLIDPDEGEVFIDGKSIKEYDIGNLRSHIGCVPQEVFLFSDTIEENIAFGIANNFNEVDVLQAAKDAVVYDNIMEFPDGFKTMVGERGVTLSGGQKQRVSIARAIIKKPGLLIFDDCLSAVDTLTEEHILQNLNAIMKGRSTVLVSHRISTVKNANRILVIDQGKIIESGTHEQLINLGGTYASLFEMQQLEGQTS